MIHDIEIKKLRGEIEIATIIGVCFDGTTEVAEIMNIIEIKKRI